MIVWLNLDRELALEPERELRARADGAVHARRRPRRVHRARRARAGARADRVRLRLERRARDAQLPLRPDPPRHRRQDDLRQDRRVDLGARRGDVRPAPAPPVVLRPQAVELLHPDAAVGRGPPGARALYVSSGYQMRPVLEAILLHPDLHAGPAHGEAAGGLIAGLLRALQRGDRQRAWVWLARARASGSSTRPTSPAGTTRAGSTRARCAAASSSSRARCPDRVLDGDAVDDYDETETPEAARRRGARLAGNPDLTAETVGAATSFAADALAGAAGWQEHLPRPAPERAPPADPGLPRLPDELTMANCGCNDYSRTQLLRRAAAEAGRGLPAIEPGMPLPAGTGLTRRSFVSRATGLALAVYGAASLGPKAFEEGIAAAAAQAPDRPRARVGLPLGRRRLADAAGADERASAVRAPAPDARAARRPGHGARRGPEPALAPVARRARRAARRGQGHA